MIVFQILILLTAAIASLINENLYENSIIALWCYALAILLEVFYTKKVSLILIFLVAFLYMIPPEGILDWQILYHDWGINNANTGFSYLLFSSTFVFLGAKLIKYRTDYRSAAFSQIVNPRLRKKFITILVGYSIFYFLINLQGTLYSLYVGRTGFTVLGATQLTAIALIVMALISFTVKNKLRAFAYSLPIVITLFATGTRLLIVYAIFMMYSENLMKITKKKMFYLPLAAGTVIMLMGTLRENRNTGILSGNSEGGNHKITEAPTDLSEKIAILGSNEGLIRNLAMINHYTTNNDYTYGSSIGFLVYWWVPRELWAEKPVMLDYWLIREYYPDQFGEGHSTASSYGGELYMDFGFIIGCILMLFFGIVLGKLQHWIDNHFYRNVYTVIVGSFLFGWAFFGTRSIMTASFMLLWIILFANIIVRLLLHSNIIITKKSEPKLPF